jgi:hypothetical protein
MSLPKDHTFHWAMTTSISGLRRWYVLEYKLITTDLHQLHQYGGEPTATLEHPPNIREFDPVSSHTIVSKSPLLQARLKAMEKEKGPQQPPAPVFNVILPDNAYGHFQPALRDPFPPAPLAVHAPLPPTGLIPGTHSEGMKMDIATFCHVYALPDVVLQRFQEHAISGTHAFSHISSSDLTGMGFRLGEVIDLKEAIGVWATAKSV